MSLHETVLDEGRIKVYSRFKPGDLITNGTFTVKIVGVLVTHIALYDLGNHVIGPFQPVDDIDAEYTLVPQPKTFLNVYATDEPGEAWYTSHETRALADAAAVHSAAARIAVATIHGDNRVTIADTRGEQ